MFQFTGFPSAALWIYAAVTRVFRAGFPHSDIRGSRCICHSPRLFAACHVFLRLLVPRHPPCALNCLNMFSSDERRGEGRRTHRARTNADGLASAHRAVSPHEETRSVSEWPFINSRIPSDKYASVSYDSVLFRLAPCSLRDQSAMLIRHAESLRDAGFALSA